MRGKPLYHLFNTLFLVLGIAFLITGAFPYTRALACSDWPFVLGRIQVSELRTPDPAKGFSLSRKVKVEYTYDVDNTRYEGKRIDFGVGSKAFILGEFAERVLQRYPVGQMVRVYYNPARPGESVLERSPSLGSGLIWMLCAVVFLAASFLISFPDPLENRNGRIPAR